MEAYADGEDAEKGTEAALGAVVDAGGLEVDDERRDVKSSETGENDGAQQNSERGN